MYCQCTDLSRVTKLNSTWQVGSVFSGLLKIDFYSELRMVSKFTNLLNLIPTKVLKLELDGTIQAR